MSNFLVKNGDKAEWGYPEGYPYKEGVTIEWDGNTEGLANISGMLYKVSDAILTDEEIINGIFTIYDSGHISEIVVSDHFNVNVNKPNVIIDEYIGIIREGNDGLGTGVYFFYYDGTYVASFKTEAVFAMSKEFLPTETWTFTLSDGSTVSKKVAVGV